MGKKSKIAFQRTAVAVLLFLQACAPAFCAFQESLWGARPTAMAGAFSAVADDANAPAYNPAGISWLTQSELTFMYAQLYTGLNLFAGQDTSRLGLNYFSFVPSIKDKKYGSYGVSWSNFTATNLYREDTFTFTAADSYQFESVESRPVLSYGANIKMLRRTFASDPRTDTDPVFQNGRTSSASTADLGVLFRPNMSVLPGLKFALVGQNITRPNLGLAAEDRVPERYVFGVAYQDPRYRFFNPSLDVSHRLGRSIVSVGAESWLASDTLALRAGGNQDELSGGLGYQFRIGNKIIMRFDYAILWPMNVNGSNGSHRVSITTTF